jgi:hypothetical protein
LRSLHLLISEVAFMWWLQIIIRFHLALELSDLLLIIFGFWNCVCCRYTKRRLDWL